MMKEIKKHILNLLRDSGLGRYEDAFEKYIKPSIRLQTIQLSDDNISIGESKLGGNPDLPPEFIWPTWKDYHMSFIGQLNLSSLKKEVLEYYNIPDKGVLSFFYTAHPEAMYGDEAFYFNNDTAKVFYFNDNQILTRTAFPLEINEEIWFKPCKVEEFIEWSVPGPETYEISKGLGIGWNNNREDFDRYWEIFIKKFRENYLKDSQPLHRFLGNHDPIQSGFINGKYKLLLQIDSDENAGMMWGDVGMIYFCINYEQLKLMNLNDAYVIMECC